MEKPEISIILPGIRPYNWSKLYDSIVKSTTRGFELIVVGPYRPPDMLQNNIYNFKYVKDYGSPMRASNIGALLCEGKLVTWVADDAVLLPESLDKNIDLLYTMGDDTKNVVVAKYYEGDDHDDKPLQPDRYFKVNGADCTRSPFLSDDWWLFNVAIMHRSFFDSLGAWDCSFEACPMGHTDLAIRAQHAGANVAMSEFPLLDCGHMPGTTGDHAPIHYAQLGHDTPRFQQRYRDPEWANKPTKIDINNWKDSPTIWKRRFLI